MPLIPWAKPTAALVFLPGALELALALETMLVIVRVWTALLVARRLH
jgi:hypothetical protein